VTLVWLVLAAFSVAIFLVFSALVEVFKTLEQIRSQTGINDLPIPFDINAEAVGSAGLPEGIQTAERALLLVLSDRCGTCDQIAAGLEGRLPDSLWLLVAPRSQESGSKWLSRHGLTDTPRLILDYSDDIARTLGIQISPAVLRFRDGRAVAAHTLPTARRLDGELQWLRDGGADQPTYVGNPRGYETIRSIKRQMEASS
jgi:hypothetical protein